MLLSIIVPFYGVEAYLPACLDGLSLLPQESCEILLVDDCGTDGSITIAEAWEKQHCNAHILKRERNGGLSSARNTGFLAASGEYIWFLDSDDVPEAEALMSVANRAKAERLDVAKARFQFLNDETGTLTAGPALPDSGIVSGPILFSSECRERIYEPMVWQCLYRRDFLNELGLLMAEGMLFEDELFQTPALLAAKRAASFTDSILRYRQRDGSIMRGFTRNTNWCIHYLEICRRLSMLIEKTSGEPSKALSRRIAAIAVSLGRNIPAYGLSGTVREQAIAFFRENRVEIASFALASPDWFQKLEGQLIQHAPELYLQLYSLLRAKNWNPYRS